MIDIEMLAFANRNADRIQELGLNFMIMEV